MGPGSLFPAVLTASCIDLGIKVSPSAPSVLLDLERSGCVRGMSQCWVGACEMSPVSFPAPSPSDPSSRSASLLLRPLNWCLETSGTAVRGKNHYCRQRVGSRLNIQVIMKLALRARSARCRYGGGPWGHAGAGVPRGARGLPGLLGGLVSLRCLREGRAGGRGPPAPRRGQRHHCFCSDSGAQSQPVLRGSLRPSRLLFFGSNRELLTNIIPNAHSFGTTAHRAFIRSCREEGLRRASRGGVWGEMGKDPLHLGSSFTKSVCFLLPKDHHQVMHMIHLPHSGRGCCRYSPGSQRRQGKSP